MFKVTYRRYHGVNSDVYNYLVTNRKEIQVPQTNSIIHKQNNHTAVLHIIQIGRIPRVKYFIRYCIRC